MRDFLLYHGAGGEGRFCAPGRYARRAGMKPAFALSLSQDGIELFQRVPGGWTLVGTADPEVLAEQERLHPRVSSARASSA